MYVAPQEIPFDQLAYPSLGGSSTGLYDSIGDDADELLGATYGDNVSRFQPPGAGSQFEQQALGTIGAATQTALNPIGSLLSTLGSLLSQLAGSLSGAGSPPQSCPPQTGPLQPWQQPQQFFQNATGASVGDPHLSFDGTNAYGASSDAKWNSMVSHNNLLDSNSFAGGYRVSTETGQPNANGVTVNQSAAVTTDGGATRVSLDADGTASIYANGTTTSIADGQQLNLGNGETVTRTDNGLLIVRDSNGRGGEIATTLSSNGKYVNVSAEARNVDLGGYLVTGGTAQPDALLSQSGIPYAQPDGQPFAPSAIAPHQPPPFVNSRRYAFDDDVSGAAAPE
jgi:hypothetical protein